MLLSLDSLVQEPPLERFPSTQTRVTTAAKVLVAETNRKSSPSSSCNACLLTAFSFIFALNAANVPTGRQSGCVKYTLLGHHTLVRARCPAKVHVVSAVSGRGLRITAGVPRC